jgi:hypothetical protein
MITCLRPVALSASRNSALSNALTSPTRRINGALGCMSRTSLRIGPLGPVSAVVVSTMGMSKRLASDA